MRIKLTVPPTPEQEKALTWLGHVEDRGNEIIATERERAIRNREKIVAQLRAAFSSMS